MPGGSSGIRSLLDPRVLALLLVAIALRIWSLLSLSRDLRVSDPILDGLHYLNLARRLSQGSGWPPEPHFLTPLYPFVLSLVYRVAPATPLTAHLFQSVLGLATLGLLADRARRDLGTREAWAMALLFVLCGPVLGMESQLLTESLLLFLTALALWLWPRPGSGTHVYLLFGVTCGLLTIGRAVFLLLPVVAVARLAFQREGEAGPRRRERLPWSLPSPKLSGKSSGGAPRAWLSRSALVGAGVVLALTPLIVHQSRATGHLQVLTLNGGMNLYFGNNAAARGIFSEPPGIDLEMDYTATRSASLLAGRELSLEESSRFWRERALSFMRAQPRRALWLLGRKALLYLSPREIPQIEDFQVLKQIAWPLRAAFVDFRWVLPLALLGLLAASRPQWGRMIPWLLLAAVGWISTILFFATGRYRVPVLPGFLAPASLGAAALYGMLRERRARPVLLVLPAVVGLQLLLPGYPLEKARAFDAYQLAIRQGRQGRVEAALESYRQAAQDWPEGGEAWHGMGVCLAQLGRLPAAAAAYRKALETIPASAPTHYNLALIYGRMGDDAKALAELQEAVRLNPYDMAPRVDLGVALARTGHPLEAAAQWRQVLRMDPGNSVAREKLEGMGTRP